MAKIDTDLYRLTEEEHQTYEEDGYFIRPTMFSADEVDVLSRRIEDLVSLMESSDVLTDEQKKLILKRNESAREKTGPASLNSLYRIHTFTKVWTVQSLSSHVI